MNNNQTGTQMITMLNNSKQKIHRKWEVTSSGTDWGHGLLKSMTQWPFMSLSDHVSITDLLQAREAFYTQGWSTPV